MYEISRKLVTMRGQALLIIDSYIELILITSYYARSFPLLWTENYKVKKNKKKPERNDFWFSVKCDQIRYQYRAVLKCRGMTLDIKYLYIWINIWNKDGGSNKLYVPRHDVMFTHNRAPWWQNMLLLKSVNKIIFQ